jgi:Phosphoesterase family
MSWPGRAGVTEEPRSATRVPRSGAETCGPVRQNASTTGIWNLLPWFDTVKADHQLGNIQSVSHFYAQAKAGTLPAVSWVVPSNTMSEHPPTW